ncbi:DmsC/YnfH family molybdoenzyme membrane anchor subunit [Selenomonas sp. oral taxon 149]|uniref:dimethyl sulfoxide reductase anchor subunit family protein n=1 Tax=Selenomonas sp. oral taxon 149 TaxID=712535 RepID=UPI0001E0C590|nr:DmsC/YnfH family molybdoenzyme membrane anchor subunit [Selenomonas sp. oral taxon 149]EFM24076.1 hypothetical protein HMPREF9166_0275 [Selenomonas sp. oral taxon 149 str. 67H29BP]
MMTFDELPLVFFTTLSQIAVGAFLFLTIIEAKNSLEQKVVRFCTCVIFLCAVLSMACSTAHLGDPAGGWRALLGLDHSWLSREILGINMFCVMVVLYFFFSARNAALHRFCGILGSVAGLLSILSTSLVYTLPSRPAWDAPFPLLFFLLTTFAAGSALLQFLLLQKKQAVQFPLVRIISLALLAGIVISIAYAVVQADHLMLPTGWLVLRIIVGALLPLFLLRKMSVPRAAAHRLSLWAFLLIALGELLGHQLFYASVLPFPLFH